MRAGNQLPLAWAELAGAFTSLPADSAAQVNRSVQWGVLRGVGPRAIEREMRMHFGARGSLLEGDRGLPSDLRRIGYKTVEELGYEPTRENLLLVRKEAGQIRDRARMIARNEISVAEHETNAQAVADSPVVLGLKVRLSARHPVPDRCDAAAAADLYGLGAGVYPRDRVPTRFHPRCLCIFAPVLRPREEWGTPLPPSAPAVVDWEAIADAHGLSPSQLAAWRGAAVGDA